MTTQMPGLAPAALANSIPPARSLYLRPRPPYRAPNQGNGERFRVALRAGSSTDDRRQ